MLKLKFEGFYSKDGIKHSSHVIPEKMKCKLAKCIIELDNQKRLNISQIKKI